MWILEDDFEFSRLSKRGLNHALHTLLRHRLQSNKLSIMQSLSKTYCSYTSSLFHQICSNHFIFVYYAIHDGHTLFWLKHLQLAEVFNRLNHLTVKGNTTGSIISRGVQLTANQERAKWSIDKLVKLENRP